MHGNKTIRGYGQSISPNHYLLEDDLIGKELLHHSPMYCCCGDFGIRSETKDLASRMWLADKIIFEAALHNDCDEPRRLLWLLEAGICECVCPARHVEGMTKIAQQLLSLSWLLNSYERLTLPYMYEAKF
jgi:hypothetical protein